MYNQDGGEQPTIDLNKVESSYNQPPNQLDKPYGRERPLGITLIAILQFVGAGLSTLLALVVGLWQLQPWARTTFLVFAILFPLAFSIFFSPISGGSVLSIVLIVLNVA